MPPSGTVSQQSQNVQAASYPPPAVQQQPQYDQKPPAYTAGAGQQQQQQQMGGGGAQAATQAQRLLAGAARDLQEALEVLKKGSMMSGDCQLQMWHSHDEVAFPFRCWTHVTWIDIPVGQELRVLFDDGPISKFGPFHINYLYTSAQVEWLLMTYTYMSSQLET